MITEKEHKKLLQFLDNVRQLIVGESPYLFLKRTKQDDKEENDDNDVLGNLNSSDMDHIIKNEFNRAWMKKKVSHTLIMKTVVSMVSMRQ